MVYGWRKCQALALSIWSKEILTKVKQFLHLHIVKGIFFATWDHACIFNYGMTTSAGLSGLQKGVSHFA